MRQVSRFFLWILLSTESFVFWEKINKIVGGKEQSG